MYKYKRTITDIHNRRFINDTSTTVWSFIDIQDADRPYSSCPWSSTLSRHGFINVRKTSNKTKHWRLLAKRTENTDWVSIMSKTPYQKPLLSDDEEAALISNILSEQDNEIGAYSQRLLDLHYKRLIEIDHEWFYQMILSMMLCPAWNDQPNSIIFIFHIQLDLMQRETS